MQFLAPVCEGMSKFKVASDEAILVYMQYISAIFIFDVQWILRCYFYPVKMYKALKYNC